MCQDDNCLPIYNMLQGPVRRGGGGSKALECVKEPANSTLMTIPYL